MIENYISVCDLVENANKLGIDIDSLLSVTPEIYVDTLLVESDVDLRDIEYMCTPTLYESFMKKDVMTKMVNKLLQCNVLKWVHTRDIERGIDQYKFSLKVVVDEEKK